MERGKKGNCGGKLKIEGGKVWKWAEDRDVSVSLTLGLKIQNLQCIHAFEAQPETDYAGLKSGNCLNSYIPERTFFFFFFQTTEIFLGCTKMEILGGNFLTSPTFDCTPSYAPEFIVWSGSSFRQTHCVVLTLLDNENHC